MWIAGCKMMEETNAILSKNLTPLPFTDSANIVEGNALRMDWEENLRLTERLPDVHYDYIMGNPPFIGARMMEPSQKEDMLALFTDEKGKPLKTAGNLDYVVAWYWKAVALSCADGRARTPASPRCAFVSTNSITQGEQVAAVWKPLQERFGLEIDFAWRTFVWDSEASEKAHVHVVIIGFHAGEKNERRLIRSSANAPQKMIFDRDQMIAAEYINGYLMDGPDVFVESRTTPFAAVPLMGIGNKPIDGGNYLFTEQERDEFLKREPRAVSYFDSWLGAEEFINGKKRYCLWLGDASPAEILAMPECVKRIQAVHDFRLASKSEGTRMRL